MRAFSGISIESTVRSFLLLPPTSRCPRTCRNKTKFSLRLSCRLVQIELNFFLISFYSSLIPQKNKRRNCEKWNIAAFNLILLLCDFYV